MKSKRGSDALADGGTAEQDGSRPLLSPGEAARKRAAFAVVMEQNEAVLMRVARRLCGGREEQAQDLTQEALVRGYVAFLEGRFTEGTNARAWLLRILTNQFLTENARRVRWEEGITVDELTAGGETGPESLRAGSQERPDTALLAGSLDEPLEMALSRLPDELRACVTLVDLEEMSYDAAASALSVPVGTVRSRLFRAASNSTACSTNMPTTAAACEAVVTCPPPR